MEDAQQPLLTVNPDQEAVLIGIIYVSLSVVLIIPFGLIFNLVILKDKELRGLMMYRLMNHLNWINFGQSICNLISGFFPIFPEIPRRMPFFANLIGSLANSLWLSMFPYIGVLSVSRILIIRKMMDPEKLNILLKACIGFDWIFSITFWLWSWLDMAFVYGGIGWMYDNSRSSSQPLQTMELVWSWPILLVSYLSYVGIIISLILSKKAISGEKSYKDEIMIFCQATFLNGWTFGVMLAWHSTAWLQITATYYAAIVNCAWILSACMNPIALFVINRTIRHKVIQFVLPKRRSKVGSTQQTTTTTF